MRRRVMHSVLGVALLAAVVAAAPATAGAQNGWQGFTAIDVPSGLQAGGPNDSPAWSAGITEDLAGGGVDVWVNNHAERSEGLEDYIGGAGVFTDATVSTLTLADTHGVTFSDIDGDGDEDLLEVMGRGNDNRLFENIAGDLSLVDTPIGLEDFMGRGRNSLFADVDNDGDMDVFVANLDRAFLPGGGDPENDPTIAAPSELYLNNGNGTSWTKVADPDEVIDDGSIRILSMTSTGPGTDQVVLTHNTFAIALDSVALGSATLTAADPAVKQFLFAAGNVNNTRDVVLGDIDGDLAPEFVASRQDDFLNTDDDNDNVPDFLGELPIVTGNISTSNLSSTVATPVSTDLLADNCRAVSLADFDNDADLDIFGGCTFLEKDQSVNVVLLNDGQGNFSIASGMVPTTTADTATVVVNADFNGDGWVDTYVGAGYDSQAGPDKIFLNQGGNGNHWLEIDLVGSNPDAMGAQVFVGTDKWQVRESGHRIHHGQDMKTLHFGLGSETSIAPIEIMWPDGTFETCTVAGIDRRVTITQGSNACSTQTESGMLAALAAAPDRGPQAPKCAGRTVTVELSKGETPTQGDDVILGTEGADTINALGGDDVICALGGDDIIDGGDGLDRIYAAAGNDEIRGGEGRDRIFAGDGNDKVWGGKNRDVIVGNRGRDTIHGESGRDRINGSVGNDTITGGGGNDQLKGGRGIDSANGGIGTDSCIDFESLIRCEE